MPPLKHIDVVVTTITMAPMAECARFYLYIQKAYGILSSHLIQTETYKENGIVKTLARSKCP